MAFRLKSIAFIFVFMFIFLAGEAPGQISVPRADDAFRELESDQLTLRFYNALDGDPIPEAKIEIKDVGDFLSDHEGKVVFPIPEDGYYDVTFLKDDYIKSVFTIEIQLGTLFFNRFSISPSLPLGSIRVVLDWSKKPRDLDAHLRKMGSFHISYRNKKVSEDGAARLDRDDTNGNGPETITANNVDDQAVYHYYIHNYSNRKKSTDNNLGKSKACVKFYGGNNELLRVFQVPQNKKGTYWHVFTIDKGQLIPVNAIVNEEPGA